MEYNKRRFQKTNDKKILHKVKKHWVVMSMALLMAIGGEAAVTHVSAHADTADNNGSANSSTNAIKEQLNQKLVQARQQTQSAQNTSNNQQQNQQSSMSTQTNTNPKQISQQANALHQQILSNSVLMNTENRTKLGTVPQARVLNNNDNHIKASTTSNEGLSNGTAKPNNQINNQNQTKPNFNQAKAMSSQQAHDQLVDTTKAAKLKKRSLGLTSNGHNFHLLASNGNYNYTFTYNSDRYPLQGYLHVPQASDGFNTIYLYEGPHDWGHVQGTFNLSNTFYFDKVCASDSGDTWLHEAGTDDNSDSNSFWLCVGPEPGNNNGADPSAPWSGSTSAHVISHPFPTINLYINTPTLTVNFNYSDGNPHGNKLMGSDFKGVPGTSVNMTPPAGYYIEGGNSYNIQNGDSSDNVTLGANNGIDNDTINYQYNGVTVSTHTFENNNPNGSVTFGKNNENVTSGFDTTDWQLVYSSDAYATKSNGNVIAIEPIPVNDTINYMYGNQNEGTWSSDAGSSIGAYNYAKSTNNVPLQNVINNYTTTISDNNAKDLHAGFHIVGSNPTFPMDGGTHTVNVTPNIDNDYVVYNYNGHQWNSPNIQGNDVNSNINGTFTINDSYHPGMPDNYHLSHGDGEGTNNLTFSHQNSSHQVYILPDLETDKIDYSDLNGYHISSDQVQGNFNSDASKIIAQDVPANCKLISGDTGTYYPNGTFHVKVQPVDNIQFKDIYGGTDGLQLPSGYPEQGNYQTAYTISAPAGWAFVNPNGSLASGTNDVNHDSITLHYGTNAGTDTLDIAPVYNGLTYDYNKNTSSVEFINGTADVPGMTGNFSNNNESESENKNDDKITHHGNGNYTGINFMGAINGQVELSDIAHATNVKFDSNVDMSKIHNMNAMFANDSYVQNLDLSNLTQLNYPDGKLDGSMIDMFGGDSSLQSLTLPTTMHTQNVTDMTEMFSGDKNLSSLTWPTNNGASFDTSNVKFMSDMFSEVGLKDLTLPAGFNTSNVDDMADMFDLDINLSDLELEKNGNHFDTSDVTDMAGMFAGLDKLQTLTLPSDFDTKSLVNMAGMFSNMSDANFNGGTNYGTTLTSLTIKSPNTKFKNLNGPYGIDLLPMYKIYKGNNTSPFANDFSAGNTGTFVLTFNVMYSDIYNGTDKFQEAAPDVETVTGRTSTSINYSSGHDPSNAPYMWALVNQDGSQAQTPQLTNDGKVLVAPVADGLTYKYDDGNDSIEFVNGTAAQSLPYLLYNTLGDVQKNAKHIKFDDNIDLSKVRSMSEMFMKNPGTSSISDIDFGNNFNTSKVRNMSNMFTGNDHLTSLTLPALFDTRNVTNTNDMFGGNVIDNGKITHLKSLTIESPNTQIENPSKDGLSPMYAQDLHDQYTSTVANDFSKGNMGTFVTPANVAYDDIYSSLDDYNPGSDTILNGRAANYYDPTYKYPTDSAPTGYAYVYANGNLAPSPQKDADGKVMVAPFFDGMTYKYDKKNGTVEFVHGNAASNLSNFTSSGVAPEAFTDPNTTTMTFDDDVNTSTATNMSDMFSGAPNLKTLNLGDKFNTSNVTNMSDMFAGLNQLSNLTLPKTFNTSNVTNMSGMFAGLSGLSTLTLPKSFDTSKVAAFNNMFGTYNGNNTHLNALTITWPTTKLINAALPPMYKQLINNNHNGHGYYTLSSANDFSQGNIGTFVPVANIAYDDIYRDVDGGSSVDGLDPGSDTYNSNIGKYRNPTNVAPSGWDFVDSDGEISATPISDSDGKIMVAPVFYGMTFRYDKANNNITFVDGASTANADRTPDPDDTGKIQEIKFDDGIDISGRNGDNIVGTIGQMLNNYKQLRTVVVSSDTKLGVTPMTNWINLSAKTVSSKNGVNIAPGVWTHNAQAINYVDPTTNDIIYTGLVIGKMGSYVTVGRHPSNVPDNILNNWQVSNPSQQIQIEGGVSDVNVKSAKPVTLNDSVDIVYEVKNSAGASDNITVNEPITLEGRDNSTVDFDPTNLISPNGYHLDMTSSNNPNKTAKYYQASLNSSAKPGYQVTWTHGTPVIYFRGDHKNNNTVQINQVIQSKSGVTLDVMHTSQAVSDNVGDQYQIDPNNYVPKTIAGAYLTPNNSHNSDVTEQVLEGDYGTYLNEPNVTFYYTDPNADSKNTVDYVNQNGDQVGTYSDSQPIGSTMTDMSDQSDDFAGYTYDNKPNQKSFPYGRTDHDYTATVTGKPEQVTVDYNYNGSDYEGATKASDVINKLPNGQPLLVGDTIQIPTNKIPAGYKLASDQATSYQVNYSDDTSKNSQIMLPIQIVPTKKVVPVQFVNANQNNAQVGNVNYQSEGVVDGTNNDYYVTLPDAPTGYSYQDQGVNNYNKYHITLSDVSDDNPDQTKMVTESVVGNDMTIPIDYYDQTGLEHTTENLKGQDSDGVPVEIGNTVHIPTTVTINNVKYDIDTGQPTTYTLNPNNINGTDQKYMNTLTYFIHPADHRYQIMIDAEKYTNHTDSKKKNTKISDDMVPVPVLDHVGDKITFYPDGGMVTNTADGKTLDGSFSNKDTEFHFHTPTDFSDEAAVHKPDGTLVHNPDGSVKYQPIFIGYDNFGNKIQTDNHKVTVRVTDNGLVNDSDNRPIFTIPWLYSAKYVSDAITFYYADQSNHDKIINADNPVTHGKYTVGGNVDSYITLTAHVGVPSGYQLLSDQPTVYQVTTSPQTIPLLVKEKQTTNGLSYALTIQYEDPNGKLLNSTESDIPIKITNGQSKTLDPSDYLNPGMQSSYTLDTSDTSSQKDGINKDSALDPGKSTITITNHAGSLDKTSGTVYYRAKYVNAGVTVKYINQDDNIVSDQVLPNTYAGEFISDVTNGEKDVPYGYTLNPDQNKSVTVGSQGGKQGKVVTLYVVGRPVSTLAPVEIIHSSKQFHNQNDYLHTDPNFKTPEEIYLPIAGRVGDTLTIGNNEFAKFVPIGYHFAKSNDNTYNGADFSNISFKGTLTPSDASDPDNTGVTTWHSDTWDESKNSQSNNYQGAWNVAPKGKGDPYWFNHGSATVSDPDVGGRPLIVLQADDNKVMNFDMFNTSNHLIKKVTVENGQIVSDMNGNVQTKPTQYDPAFNDRINVLDYQSFIPTGYTYDTKQGVNSSPIQYFGYDPVNVAVHIIGNPVTLNVKYQYPDGHTENALTTPLQVRVGDVINVPQNKLSVPVGYQLAHNQSLQYSVPSDASSTEDYDLKLVPDTEIIPVVFKDTTTGNVVGRTDNASGQINSTIAWSNKSIDLSKQVPAGYQLDSSDAKTYKLITKNIDPDKPTQMSPVTMNVSGNPVTVNVSYIDKYDHKVGGYQKPARVGDTITLPTSGTVRGQQGGYYTLQNPNGSLTIMPSTDTDINLPVVGQVTQTSLPIKVVYQTSQHQKVASDDNVTVNVDGPYDGITYFDPASLVVPDGYTLDYDSNAASNKGGNNQSTPGDYQIDINQKGVPSWAKGSTPTIVFTGGKADNKQFVVNRVVESPDNVVIGVYPETVNVSGNVGSDYNRTLTSLAPTDANGNAYPVKSGQPTSIGGKILKSGYVTYLSQPTDTVYYVDPNAKSQITVYYVDQYGNYVTNYVDKNNKVVTNPTTSDKPVKTQVEGIIGDNYDLASDNGIVKKNVPVGYTYNQPSILNNITFDRNDEDVNVQVSGKPASVHVDYYDGTQLVQVVKDPLSGYVGETLPITSSVPNGYHLVDGDQSNYKLTANDVSGSNVFKIQIASNQLTLPIDFKDGNGNLMGKASVSGDLDAHKNIVISSSLAPKGYHFSSSEPQTYQFTTTGLDKSGNNSNVMPTKTIQVAGDDATVNIHFVNQNGDNVQNSTISNGVIGQTFNLPTVPGYESQTTQYTFDPENINGPVAGQANKVQMNDYTVYVNGVYENNLNKLPVTIQYENFRGKNTGVPQTDSVQLSLNRGDTGTFYPSDISTPSGYKLDYSKTASSDQFTDNKGTAAWVGSQPVIYFMADPSSSLTYHQIDVAQFMQTANGINLGIRDIQVPVSDEGVGDKYSIHASDIKAPAHYQLKPGDDKLITGTIMPYGLSNDHVDLHYVGDSDTLNLQFRVNGDDYNVESDLVSGTYGKPLDAMDYLPDGYRLDLKKNNVNDLNYTFGKIAQPIIVYVQPDVVSGPSLNVKLNFYDHSDNTPLYSRTVTIPVQADHSGDFTISPSDSQLASDIVGFDPAHNLNIKGNVGHTSDGIQVSQNTAKTFNYRAKLASMKIAFVNQAGQYVNPDNTLSSTPTSTTVNGYYDQTVNLQNKIPSDYHYVSGNLNEKLMNQSTPDIITVFGNPLVNASVTVNLVEEDPNGNKQHDPYQIQVPVKGHIGNQYVLDANDLTPSGYKASPANQSASWVLSSGPIKPVTFTYRSTAKMFGTKGIYLQPINITFLDNGEQMGNNVLIHPQTTDYDGEVVNLAVRAEKYVPAGYQIADQKDLATFGTTPFNKVYVNVKRMSGNPLTFNALVIQQFHDPSDHKLIKVVSTPIAESGDVGDSFTIKPQAVDGYTLKNDQNYTGKIMSSGLIGGTVIYNYVAEQSSPSSKAAVGPIYVTYVNMDNGKAVGSDNLQNQPINGYMDQMVDVLDKTQMPSGYQLAPGQTPLAAFNSSVQHVNISVIPDVQKATGQITITYHDLQDNSDKQITVSDYAGSNFELSPYETAVPQGYQFAGVSQGKDINSFNDARQDITIDVNKLISDQIVYMDVSDYEDKVLHKVNMEGMIPENDVVGRQTVQGLAVKSGTSGTPIDYSNYTTFIPDGYKFDHLDNNVEYTVTGRAKPNIIWVKHNRTHIFSTITVNYNEYSSDNHFVKTVSQSVSGRSGDSFNIADFEDQTPNGYDYVSTDMAKPIDYFTDQNQTINIKVQKPTPVPQFGAVKVHFVKATDPTKEIASITVTGHDQSIFDLTPFEHQAPNNYVYDSVINDEDHPVPNVFEAGKTQNLYIKVIK